MASNADLFFNVLVRDAQAKREFRALKKEIDDLRKSVGKLDGADGGGKKAGSSFADSFKAAFDGGLKDPKMAAVVVGLAANAAPAIAAVLNAGILAGLGGGAIAVGLATAAKDPRVAKAGSDLSTNFLQTMTSATEPFVEPMIRGLNRLQSTVTDIGPDLHDVFAGLAPSVDKLFAGVDGLVRKALPGLKKGLEGAAPVLDAISAGLPAMGKAIGDFFAIMATDSKRMAGDMKILMGATSGAIFATAVAVKFLSTVFNDSVVRGLQLVKVIGAIGQVVASPIGGDGFFAGMSKWAKEALDSYTGKQKEVADATGETKSQTDSLTGSLFGLGEGFSAAMDKLSGNALGYEQSIIAVKDAVDQVGKAFDENGSSLDVNTEAGRRNRSEVLSGIQAAKAHADQVYEMNRAVMGNDAAMAHAGTAFDKYTGELYANAAAHGADKGQLEQLRQMIDSLKPKTVDIRINTIRTNITREMVAGSNGVSLSALEYYGLPRAMGGIDLKMANGGITSKWLRSPTILAGERGSEAYISMTAPKQRSRAIADQAVGMLGGSTSWGDSGGGYAITVNVNGMGASGQQIGEVAGAAIVSAIKQYEKSNGSGWRS